MRQWTHREFVKVVRNNGFTYNRHSGDHAIYVKDNRHISIPQKLECVIARRLIREYNLIIETKNKSKR